MNDLSFAATRFSLAALVAAGVAAGSVRQEHMLSALTVPAAALPSGCALAPQPAPTPAPVSRGGATVILGSGAPLFPTNPWSGTDRKLVAAVHMAIDATPRAPLPDVPPTAARDAAASELKWADDILEAYHAAYMSMDGHGVAVLGVAFNDAKLTAPPDPLSAMLNPSRGVTSRIVRAATVVRVSAPTSTACFKAVRAYIESLK